MGRVVLKAFYTSAIATFFAASSLASPLSSRLLPLVPPGAEIVAGFEYRPSPDLNGSLLLTTRNNRLDLDDWQALTGADSSRTLEALIEVAAAGPNGSVSEHMLLVAGQFDRERIFRSIQENGTKSTEHEGHPVLLIKPLAREVRDMLDTRWLVILDKHIGILGTPWLVKKAMARYAEHAVPDSVLEERLSLLQPDVTSWNVVAVSRLTARDILFAQRHTRWEDVQRDADVLTVAARFGSRIRIDFSIEASGRGPDFFTRKAEFFTDPLTSGPSSKPTSLEAGSRRRSNLTLQPDRLQGSVELSAKQFEAWCAFFHDVPPPQPTAHGD